MPEFTFNGFPAGSTVSISAVQGAISASRSVSTWGQGNLAALNILQVKPGELVAPVGIWFEAVDISGFDVAGPGPGEIYDPSAHEITYIWDFDDPGTFATALNMPPEWNNKAIDYGKKVYHVFETPGIYNVRLWAIDASGNIGERIVEVVVQDPDTLYAAARTICVSQTSDFTGAPAGANTVTSMSAAVSALEGLGTTGRILLRAGETFIGKINIDDPMVNFRLGSFGTGPKPVLQAAVAAPSMNSATILDFRNANSVTDSAFYGLRFEGDWDAATETGDPRTTPMLVNTHNTNGWNLLVYQCEFDGVSSVSPSTGADVAYTSAMVDCDITNWQDYGIRVGGQVYNPSSRFALVGCSIHQKENACKGDHGGKIGLGNDHGPFRYSDVMQVIVSCSDFYSANSWPGGVQPCVRFAQGGNGSPAGDYFLNVNRIACEGGGLIGGIDGQNSGAPEFAGNHVLDMVLLVNDYDTRDMFGVAYGGTTLRNCYFALLDVVESPTFSTNAAFLDFGTDNPQPGNADAMVNVYNCTFLNMKSDEAPQVETTLAANFNNTIVENNIHHAPNQPMPVTTDAPIDTVTPITGFQPRNRGIRKGPEKVLGSLSASVPSGSSTTMPYPAETGASDYQTGGRHTVLIGGDDYYFSYRGDCALSFGLSEITVTNTSGTTWAAGAAIRLGLDQATLTTDTTHATTGIVPYPVPLQGSPAATSPGGRTAYQNLLGTVRSTPPLRGAF